MLRAALAALLLSYAPATELCRFADPRIDESSGVSASSRSDDLFFTHNDSGDAPRFFAVDRQGATLGVFDVDGARAEDWEDMARGRTDEGKPVLFFADIGDNFRRRATVVVYEVLEPKVRDRDAAVNVLRLHELRYEDGPHDAETLLVHPRDRRMFVVTKDRDGAAGVYRADGKTLTRVADVRLDVLVPRGSAYARAITAGEIGPDGRRVVLRTPFQAFEWDIETDVVEAFAREPRRIPLPETRQGEAVAYTRGGSSLVLTSEGTGAPVHLLEGTTIASPNWLQPAEPIERKPSDGRSLEESLLLVAGWFSLAFLARVLLGRMRRRRRPPLPPPRSA